MHGWHAAGTRSLATSTRRELRRREWLAAATLADEGRPRTVRDPRWVDAAGKVKYVQWGKLVGPKAAEGEAGGRLLPLEESPAAQAVAAAEAWMPTSRREMGREEEAEGRALLPSSAQSAYAFDADAAAEEAAAAAPAARMSKVASITEEAYARVGRQTRSSLSLRRTRAGGDGKEGERGGGGGGKGEEKTVEDEDEEDEAAKMPRWQY